MDAVEITRPSPDRVAPRCPYAGPGRCGGCDWQHVAIEAQRSLKASLVAEQLRRLAGIEHVVEVEEVPGSPDGLGWRTRVRFGVDEAGRVGLHRHRSHELEPVDRCLIASAAVEAIGVESHLWPEVDDLEVFASDESGESVLSLTSRSRRLPNLPALDTGLVVNGRVAREPERLAFKVLRRRYEVSSGRLLAGAPGGRKRPRPSRAGWARRTARRSCRRLVCRSRAVRRACR